MQNLSQKMQTYYQSQISVLEKHNLVYISCNLSYNYLEEKNKFKKGFPKDLGQYKDIHRETKEFEYGKHNAVCVMMGENYGGIILVDIDNDEGTLDRWNELMVENGLCDTLQSKTINNGMHYYFQCTEEQRKAFSGMAFTSSNHKLFEGCIDIKYTNQLSFECSSIEKDGENFKYEFLDDNDILPLPQWIFAEILRVKQSDTQSNLLSNYVKRNSKPIEIFTDDSDEEEDETITQLKISKIDGILNSLPSVWYDDYDNWCRIGFMLKSNNDLSDTQNYKLFLKFSKKSASKFTSEMEVLKNWKSWKDGTKMEKGLTIATLYALGDKISAKQKKKSSSSQEEEVIISNDTEGADLILKMTKDSVILSNKQIYLRKGNGNIFEVDESKNNEHTKNYLISAITNNNICVQRGKHIVSYSKNASGARNILSLVLPRMIDDTTFKSKDEVFSTKLWKSNLLKLCFLDGYYDFKDSTFKPYDDKTYSTICIKRKFPLKRDEDVIQEVYDKVLNKLFHSKEKLKYFLNWCARSLAGEVEDKSWSNCLGNRNSSKGVLYKLFKNTFEDYVDSFLAEELLIVRVNDGDSAKKYAWTIPLMYKRLCFSNEIKTHDMTGNPLKLDGAVIKKLTSGGDEIHARLNYKDQINFKIQAHIAFFANDTIEVAPSDALSTVNVFDFDCEFVDQEELTEEQKRVNETSTYKYYISDPHVKTNFLERQDVIDAFFHIILDHYSVTAMIKPKCVCNNVDEMLDTSNGDKEKVLENFEITRDENDLVPVGTYNDINHRSGITKAKGKMVIKQLGILQKQKKNKEGKNIKWYRGMKIKEAEVVR